jgi:hypothetical protein
MRTFVVGITQLPILPVSFPKDGTELFVRDVVLFLQVDFPHVTHRGLHSKAQHVHEGANRTTLLGSGKPQQNLQIQPPIHLTRMRLLCHPSNGRD